MGFQGREFVFESPAAAVAGLISHMTKGSPVPPATRPSETVSLQEARGRLLAEPIACDRDSPAFDYAAMDGYAVRAADVRAAAAHARRQHETSMRLAVVGESRIGCMPPALVPLPREAAPRAIALRTATGAPIPGGPHGADAIIKREDVAEHAEGAGHRAGGVGEVTVALDIADRIAPGDHVRRCGENARAGDAVLMPGEVLSASALGTLAAVGKVAPRVYQRMRVAVITTGDEVVAPDQTPGPFQIRNSNATAMAAILASQAWIELTRVSHVTDDGDLTAALRSLLDPPAAAEAVILTGGVSMGHRDPVRPAVEGLGAQIVFHGLPQRPGKPMLGALLEVRPEAVVPIFGLPGNPLSALVTCTRIVLPVLARCAGASRTPATLLPRLVELAGDDGRRIGLWWHRPALLRTRDNGATVAELVDSRGSGDVVSAARSDGFVELPPSRSASADTQPPTRVAFYPWPA